VDSCRFRAFSNPFLKLSCQTVFVTEIQIFAVSKVSILQMRTDLSNPNAWITETNLTLTRPIEYRDGACVDIHTSTQKFYQVLPMQ
jgi:hypothetical protein